MREARMKSPNIDVEQKSSTTNYSKPILATNEKTIKPNLSFKSHLHTFLHARNQSKVMASFIAKLGVRSVRGLSVAVPKVNGNALVGLKQSMFHTITATGRSALPTLQLRTPCSSPVHMTNVTRGFKNKSTTRPIKTKKSAAKRIIRTGSGTVLLKL